jgi:hypothetical protein
MESAGWLAGWLAYIYQSKDTKLCGAFSNYVTFI